MKRSLTSIIVSQRTISVARYLANFRLIQLSEFRFVVGAAATIFPGLKN